MEYDFSFSEGLRFKMLGNPVEADKFFTKCIGLQLESPAPYYEMGKIAFVMKDLLTAREYVEKARLLDSSNEWYALLEVKIAEGDKRDADAAELYKNLFNKDQSRYEFLVAEIDRRIRAKDCKEAKKRIRLLCHELGYGAHIAFRLRDIYLAEGKNKKALKEIEKLVNAYPESVEYRGILAELMLDMGEEALAVEEFNKIKAVNSGNPIVYFSLGQYYLQKGEKEKAIEEFKTGFKSKQVNPEIKISIFLELLKKEKDNESISDSLTGLLNALYESDKGNPDVDALYADNIYRIGRIEEAETIYRRVVKNNKGNYMAWQNLLFIQNSQLDFREMYDLAKEAVLAFPNQAIFYLFKGIGANAMKDYENAVDALNNGARLNRNNTELTKQFYISLGDAYYNLNNYKEAFLNFDLLLVLEPDNEVV
ncbi:MAG: hypothetical protein J7L96_00545, partial [Bacteroidales bacterium]|nr:hypothetical protein [Bacteroidales bacterium]